METDDGTSTHTFDRVDTSRTDSLFVDSARSSSSFSTKITSKVEKAKKPTSNNRGILRGDFVIYDAEAKPLVYSAILTLQFPNRVEISATHLQKAVNEVCSLVATPTPIANLAIGIPLLGE